MVALVKWGMCWHATAQSRMQWLGDGGCVCQNSISHEANRSRECSRIRHLGFVGLFFFLPIKYML
jgi:hypothetical protein